MDTYVFLLFLCAVIWVCMSMASSQMWRTALLWEWPRYVISVGLNDSATRSDLFSTGTSCDLLDNHWWSHHRWLMMPLFFDSCVTSGQPTHREEGWCRQSSSPLCWGCPASCQAREPGKTPSMLSYTDSIFPSSIPKPRLWILADTEVQIHTENEWSRISFII